jgi:hypothetical protein
MGLFAVSFQSRDLQKDVTEWAVVVLIGNA